MTNNSTPNILDRMEAFNQYARFISQKFGVSVILDGIEAKTDGTTIHLPNLATMSTDEVDFLYCVLLHEVGHIKYSNFSKDLFAKIKSEAHFEFFNAIEDARIENALMSDYSGAEDIFTDLYHRFACDDNFMKRIFGFTSSDVTKLRATSTYTHCKLLRLSAQQSLGKKVNQYVASLPFKSKLDNLLDKASLSSTEDSLKLATKIYDLYFKDKVDRSGENEIPKQEQVAKQTLDQLSKLHQAVEKENKEIDALKEKIKNLRKKLSDTNEQIAPFKEKEQQLEKLIGDCEQKLSPLDLQDHLKQELQHSKTSLAKAVERLAKKEPQVSDLNNKIDQLKKKVAELEDLVSKAKPYSSEKGDLNRALSKNKTRLTKAIADQKRNQRILDKHRETTQSREDQIKHLEQQIADLEQQIKNVGDPTEIKKKVDELSSEHNKLQQQHSKLDDTKCNTKEEMFQLTHDLNQRQSASVGQTLQVMKELQKAVQAAGLPMQMVEDFQPVPGWDSANDVQQQFDQQATTETGKMVVNGGFSGSNIRDMVLLIEKGTTDLQTIDLVELFKQKHSVSKLDSFNDVSQVKNTEENDRVTESTTLKDTRKHLPLTNQFDAVKTSNVAAGAELHKLREVNVDTISQVKKIFRQKLNYQKKIRFHGGQEEGELDSRALWKLATNSGDDFYEIPHPIKVNQVVASIALDISGSMEKNLVQRQALLKEVALILSDGLIECHIRHEVCGYHAPVCDEMRALPQGRFFNRTHNKLETVIYKTFGDKNNNGIENLEVQCTDNSDGESLRIIGGRLFKERAKRKILFVVTDGKPFLSGSDINLLDKDLKDTLDWLRGNKIEVYALGLHSHVPKLFGTDSFVLKGPTDLASFAKDKIRVA